MEAIIHICNLQTGNTLIGEIPMWVVGPLYYRIGSIFTGFFNGNILIAYFQNCLVGVWCLALDFWFKPMTL